MIPRFWRPSRHPLWSRTLNAQVRPLSSTAIHPVNLHFDKLVPKNGNETDRPLVILHGLLYVLHDHWEDTALISHSGMKRNWLSLSKAFLRDLDTPIYALVRRPNVCARPRLGSRRHRTCGTTVRPPTRGP